MRRSRKPASSYCIASGRDSSHWDVWAFKASLRLRFGTRCLGLEVSTAAKGKRSFARDCYLHQSPFDPGMVVKTGASLVRQWRGHTHTVLVREDGFEYEGQCYRSLTVIAERI